MGRSACRKVRYSMLEPDAGKLARPVLRGGSASKGAALPDRRGPKEGEGEEVASRTGRCTRRVSAAPAGARGTAARSRAALSAVPGGVPCCRTHIWPRLSRARTLIFPLFLLIF